MRGFGEEKRDCFLDENFGKSSLISRRTTNSLSTRDASETFQTKSSFAQKEPEKSRFCSDRKSILARRNLSNLELPILGHRAFSSQFNPSEEVITIQARNHSSTYNCIKSLLTVDTSANDLVQSCHQFANNFDFEHIAEATEKN